MLQKRKQFNGTIKQAPTKPVKPKEDAAHLIAEFAELLPADGLNRPKKSKKELPKDQLQQVGAFRAFPIRLSDDTQQHKNIFIRKIQQEETEFSLPEEINPENTLLAVNLVYDATEDGTFPLCS